MGDCLIGKQKKISMEKLERWKRREIENWEIKEWEKRKIKKGKFQFEN